MGFGIVHTLITEYIGIDKLFITMYILNLIFGIISFKLGFARELPLLKMIIVYILLFIGFYVITIFSVLGLPMTESLIIISIVLAIYRFRLHRERKEKQET